MGAYLSEPLTNKESEDGTGNKLRFGVSTMQGWRASQEDAHHCVTEFDENSSLYGIFDGHGGHEVAVYVAKHFPDMLKRTDAYLAGDIEKAFIEAYLKMDASIKEPPVLAEIQKLAKGGDNSEEAGVEDDEDVNELYEEATMPLEQLVAKYHKSGGVDTTTTLVEENIEKPGSSRKLVGGGCTSMASTSTSISSESSSSPCKEGSSTEPTKEKDVDAVSSSSGSLSTILNVKLDGMNGDSDKINTTCSSSTDAKKDVNVNNLSVSHESASCEMVENSAEEKPSSTVKSSELIFNGSEIPPDTIDSNVSSSETAVKGSEVETSPTKPRKGKVHPVPVVIIDPQTKRRAASRKANLAGLMAFGDESGSSDFDSSDEDHPTFLAGSSDSDEDDDEDAEDESEDSDDVEEDDNFVSDFQEPGYDSGCTAVVSFFRWEDDGKLNLWVANAGDSRCVVSRNGMAVEMSYDHKPEADEESLRIVKAGGKVTEEGRVNGGLNLSRALGDHAYKQNADLPLEEQMISPKPSIQYLELNLESDDFVVLACDGVWNCMTSQEVVDFIKERISNTPSLSKICEELFQVCLAEDTCGDGTGCDNMTAIIVEIPKRPSLKRNLASATEEANEVKRQKIDE